MERRGLSGKWPQSGAARRERSQVFGEDPNLFQFSPRLSDRFSDLGELSELGIHPVNLREN